MKEFCIGCEMAERGATEMVESQFEVREISGKYILYASFTCPKCRTTLIKKINMEASNGTSQGKEAIS